jgi:periplasmic divalent cation tolerance protein
MKNPSKFALVLVTAPDLKTARQLARAALEAKVIACANLVPAIESHYWWQNQIERGREVLLVLKTTRARVRALKALVLTLHPYETPEFVVLPIAGGSKAYLDWVAAAVG